MELNAKYPFWQLHLPTNELSNHDELCKAFAEHIGSGITEPANTGLYLASSNAGMMPSVQFWQLAQEQGPGFMSPQNFPWTLANAPASCLAIALDLQGPNYTFLGDASASQAALEQAHYDLEAGIIRHALIVAVDFGFEKDSDNLFAGLLLGKEASTSLLDDHNTSIKLSASDYLIQFCEQMNLSLPQS